MPELHFQVKVDIIVGGRMHVIQPECAAQGKGLGDMIDLRPQAPPTTFFVAAWFGNNSQHLSLDKVRPDGTAEVKIPIDHDVVDRLKIGVNFNVQNPSITPRPPRNYHLASSSVPMKDILAMLAQAPDGDFEKCQQCFSMKDNYSRNTVILKFANVGTDLTAVGQLRLRPSALNQLERITESVYRLGLDVHSKVVKCTVSQCNAGPQYMDAFTFLPMEKMLSHYSILGLTLQSLPSPVDLSCLMYIAYQAAHSTQIHPRALAAMPADDLVAHFGNPMLAQHCACELTSTYSSDLTLNPVGAVCRVTEDIQSTLSSVAMQTQGVTKRFRSDVDVAKMSDVECAAVLAGVVQGFGAPRLQLGMGGAIANDDCENLMQVFNRYGTALRSLYRNLVGKTASPDLPALGQRLAGMMNREAKSNPLFANLTLEDHTLMAPVLLRLGELVHTGRWQTALIVVSAKGPSYVPNAPTQAADALCGHAAAVSRTIHDGKCVLHPLEGTTWMNVFPEARPGLAKTLGVKLADGSISTFNVPGLATAISQNVHEIAGITTDYRIKAHMASEYSDATDLTTDSPFYVAAFYSGLQQGVGTLGSVPVDCKPAPGLSAGNKPLFGAPVLGLCRNTTKALPVHIAQLADPVKQDQAELMTLLRQQWSEIWSPAANKDTLHAIMSYWQPIAKPAWDTMRSDYGTYVRCENTWAFDNPDHVAMATRVYGALAAKFNELQAAEKVGDGARADVHGKFRSAALALTLNIPKVGQQFDLSCMKNLRKAVKAVGLAKLAAVPVKMNQIHARAQVATNHPVYMCARGGGVVHSHRIKLK